MQDDKPDQENDQSDVKRQQEQVIIPTEQAEKADIQKSKKGNLNSQELLLIDGSNKSFLTSYTEENKSVKNE